MRPISVLHLFQGLEFGGLENVAVSLLEKLDKNRYLPSICCYDALGSLIERVNGKIKVHFIKRKQGIDYLYPFKLARLLRMEQIQILHLHNSTAFFYGVIAGKLARVPVIIYTEHARDVLPNLKVRIADKLLSIFTDRIIVVADYLKRNLVKYEKFNANKITVIYNGIDTREFIIDTEQRKIRNELGIGSNVPVIGIVARLDPIKNHKCLIKAMEHVVYNLQDAFLLIIGDGPIRTELQSLVNNLRLENNVRFLGMRSDIPELMSILDIFVLCSKSEGLPITILEAMALERSIIGTRVGGVPELIEDGVNGILIESDDYLSLSEAITELITNKARATSLGKAAKKKFMEHFTLDNMVKRYEEIYEDCMRNRLNNKKKLCA